MEMTLKYWREAAPVNSSGVSSPGVSGVSLPGTSGFQAPQVSRAAQVRPLASQAAQAVQDIGCLRRVSRAAPAPQNDWAAFTWPFVGYGAGVSSFPPVG